MKAAFRVFLTLSFVAGFADTATFIQLSGLFSAHVTGNFVLLAAAIGKGVRDEDVLKLLSFPVFFFAAALATFVHDWLQGGKPEIALDRWLTLSAAVLLLGGAGLALFYKAPPSPVKAGFADAAAGLLSVAAMGVQNALHRFAVSLGPPTTVMTGTVTQVAVLAARSLSKCGPALRGMPPGPAFSLKALAILSLAFAVGCLLSVLVTLHIGLVSLAIPGLLLIAAAFWEREN